MVEAASFVRLAAATLLAAAVSVSSACSNKPPDDPEDYVRRVVAARAEKDAEFQKASEPILDEKKPTYLPLAYFPVDPAYNIVAGLEAEKEEIVAMMPTSTGQMRKMRQVGLMHFTLKGQSLSLVAFVEVGAADMNRLTLMFSDMTSGTETYAAGRYLDLERTASDLYSLDFNLAYHPYCYYNPAYDCPFPPAENRLNVPIRAGERMRKSGEAVGILAMIRAVIFDFDGVIANSEPLHFQAFRATAARHGIDLSESAYYGRYLGFDDVGAFRAMAADAGVQLDESAIDALVAAKAVTLEDLERETSVLFPGAREAISAMAARWPTAIASGALRQEILRVLERERLQAFFPVIVAAGDTPVSKPDPAPYALAVEHLARRVPGLRPSECLAIEDSLWGLQSARRAGVRTVAITHTYPADTLRAAADLVVDRMAEFTPDLVDRIVPARADLIEP